MEVADYMIIAVELTGKLAEGSPGHTTQIDVSHQGDSLAGEVVAGICHFSEHYEVILVMDLVVPGFDAIVAIGILLGDKAKLAAVDLGHSRAVGSVNELDVGFGVEAHEDTAGDIHLGGILVNTNAVVGGRLGGAVPTDQAVASLLLEGTAGDLQRTAVRGIDKDVGSTAGLARIVGPGAACDGALGIHADNIHTGAHTVDVDLTGLICGAVGDGKVRGLAGNTGDGDHEQGDLASVAVIVVMCVPSDGVTVQVKHNTGLNDVEDSTVTVSLVVLAVAVGGPLVSMNEIVIGDDDVTIQSHVFTCKEFSLNPLDVGDYSIAVIAIVNGNVVLMDEVSTCALSCIVLGVEAVEAAALNNDGSGAILVVGVDAVEQVGCAVLAVSNLELAAQNGQRALGDGGNGDASLIRTVLNDHVACGGTVGGTQDEEVAGCVEEVTILNGESCAVHHTEGRRDAVAVHGQIGQIQSGILGDDHGGKNDDGLHVACLGSCQSVVKVGVVNVTNRSHIGLLIDQLTCGLSIGHAAEEGIHRARTVVEGLYIHKVITSTCGITAIVLGTGILDVADEAACVACTVIGNSTGCRAVGIYATVCVTGEAADVSSSTRNCRNVAGGGAVGEGSVHGVVVGVGCGTDEAACGSHLGDDVHVSGAVGDLVTHLAKVSVPTEVAEEAACEAVFGGHAGDVDLTGSMAVLSNGVSTGPCNKAANVNQTGSSNVDTGDIAVDDLGILPTALGLSNEAAHAATGSIGINNSYLEALDIKVIKDMVAVLLQDASEAANQVSARSSIDHKVLNRAVGHPRPTHKGCHTANPSIGVSGGNGNVLYGNVVNDTLNGISQSTEACVTYSCGHIGKDQILNLDVLKAIAACNDVEEAAACRSSIDMEVGNDVVVTHEVSSKGSNGRPGLTTQIDVSHQINSPAGEVIAGVGQSREGHEIVNVPDLQHVLATGNDRKVLAVCDRGIALSHEVGACALSCIVCRIEANEGTAVNRNGRSVTGLVFLVEYEFAVCVGERTAVNLGMAVVDHVNSGNFFYSALEGTVFDLHGACIDIQRLSTTLHSAFALDRYDDIRTVDIQTRTAVTSDGLTVEIEDQSSIDCNKLVDLVRSKNLNHGGGRVDAAEAGFAVCLNGRKNLVKGLILHMVVLVEVFRGTVGTGCLVVNQTHIGSQPLGGIVVEGTAGYYSSQTVSDGQRAVELTAGDLQSTGSGIDSNGTVDLHALADGSGSTEEDGCAVPAVVGSGVTGDGTALELDISISGSPTGSDSTCTATLVVRDRGITLHDKGGILTDNDHGACGVAANAKMLVVLNLGVDDLGNRAGGHTNDGRAARHCLVVADRAIGSGKGAAYQINQTAVSATAHVVLYLGIGQRGNCIVSIQDHASVALNVGIKDADLTAGGLDESEIIVVLQDVTALGILGLTVVGVGSDGNVLDLNTIQRQITGVDDDVIVDRLVFLADVHEASVPVLAVLYSRGVVVEGEGILTVNGEVLQGDICTVFYIN